MPKRARDEEDDYDDRPRKRSRRDDVEEDDPPRRRARAEEAEDDRPRRKARVEEDGDDDRPRRRARTEEDEDDRPSRRKARAEDGSDDEDDRPRKRKKPRLSKADRERMRREDDDAREDVYDNLLMEWGGPIFLGMLGVVMMIVAGVIMARRPDFPVGPAIFLVAAAIKTVITIPIVIVSLMVIGGMLGIDYGTIKNAVRSLTAIILVVSGIYAVGNLLPFGGFIALAVAGMTTFALFMLFFRLDPQETSTSLFILNLILWGAEWILVGLIIALLNRGAKQDRGFDDNRPRMQQKQDFNNQNRGGGLDDDDGN